MREVHHGGDVDLDHVEQSAAVNGLKFAVGAEPGVVDEDFHGQALLLCEGEKLLRSFGAGQVGRTDLDLDVVALGEISGKLGETFGAPGGENDVGSAGGELPREFPADAGAGTGDQRPLVF